MTCAAGGSSLGCIDSFSICDDVGMRTGVTVMPEYFQNEGVENVVARLAAAKVDMIATSPYVMEPADEKTGSREPPVDAGAGSVRLLDRTLWGKRELFVKTAPSFAPDKKLYEGLRYQPAAPNQARQSTLSSSSTSSGRRCRSLGWSSFAPLSNFGFSSAV